MDLPFYIHINSAKISPHLIFEILAFFIGFRYFLFLRRNQKDLINTENRIWILVGASLGALFGSRLLGMMEAFDLFLAGGGEIGWMYYFQQKTIVGGFLGGLFGVELVKKLIDEKHSSGDLFTFPLILGLIIGRIGCFLMGIEDGTHGNPSSLLWAMDLGDGMLRHPAALYEIVFLVFLWVGIVLLEKRVSLSDGNRFKLFMVSYLIFRLMIDWLKPGFRFEIGLTSIQIACVLGLIYYYKVIFFPWRLLESKSH